MGYGTNFDDLFVAIMPDLRRYLRTLTKDRWEADDLVQDLYVKLRRTPTSRRAWLDHPNPIGYLHRAAVNLLNDRWRQGQRRQHLLSQLANHAEHAWDGGLSQRENRIVVDDALRQLSDAEAAAVTLVDLDGQTLDRAAAILGVHRGTVHRNRQRALHRLRLMLRRRIEV